MVINTRHWKSTHYKKIKPNFQKHFIFHFKYQDLKIFKNIGRGEELIRLNKYQSVQDFFDISLIYLWYMSNSIGCFSPILFSSTNIVFSADERFDGTFQTNIVVSSDGAMLYVPPGIFKSTCKVATSILCLFMYIKVKIFWLIDLQFSRYKR